MNTLVIFVPDLIEMKMLDLIFFQPKDHFYLRIKVNKCVEDPRILTALYFKSFNSNSIMIFFYVFIRNLNVVLFSL